MSTKQKTMALDIMRRNPFVNQVFGFKMTPADEKKLIETVVAIPS